MAHCSKLPATLTSSTSCKEVGASFHWTLFIPPQTYACASYRSVHPYLHPRFTGRRQGFVSWHCLVAGCAQPLVRTPLDISLPSTVTSTHCILQARKIYPHIQGDQSTQLGGTCQKGAAFCIGWLCHCPAVRVLHNPPQRVTGKPRLNLP